MIYGQVLSSIINRMDELSKGKCLLEYEIGASCIKMVPYVVTE